MKSAILMSSVAVAALATPAFAGPDRFENGFTCGMSSAQCVQEQLMVEDGNRLTEKSVSDTSAISSGLNGSTATRPAETAALRSSATLSPSTSNGDNDLNDEIGDRADKVGNEIGDAADEAGDAISHAADEAGDAIGDAFN